MMKWRWPRWAIRISLAFLAVIIVAVAVLFILSPTALLLVLAIIFNSIFANTSPPPIVENTLAGANFGNRDEVNQNLTVLLRRNFPIGTSEDHLKSTLSGQG